MIVQGGAAYPVTSGTTALLLVCLVGVLSVLDVRDTLVPDPVVVVDVLVVLVLELLLPEDSLTDERVLTVDDALADPLKEAELLAPAPDVVVPLPCTEVLDDREPLLADADPLVVTVVLAKLLPELPVPEVVTDVPALWVLVVSVLDVLETLVTWPPSSGTR